MKALKPSPTLLSMVVYGASGVAFVGANLLLARVLPSDDYAVLTLLVALGTLGYHLAPLGHDAAVNRGWQATGFPLLRRVAVAAGIVAILVASLAGAAYQLSSGMVALLFVATLGGGLMLVAAAKFQSQQRFALSLSLLLSPNIVLLAGAGAALASHASDASLPFAIYTVGLVLAAMWGWRVLLREARNPAPSAAVAWHELLALAGVGAAGMLLIQLERLVIPYVLPLADLALFGVLGAVAGSLFRLLQMGVGYSLLPRLRAAPTVHERRRLIAQELRLAGGIAVSGALGILVLAPLIERWFLAGKYHLSTALLIAAIFSGVAKIAHAFAKSAATALATPRELAFVNGAGWLSVSLAIGASVVGARFGLAGVIYGVGAGWLAWAVMAFALVVRHLRLPVTVPAAET